eukprot:8972093-Alexandrium_andersonii.AAC.1
MTPEERGCPAAASRGSAGNCRKPQEARFLHKCSWPGGRAKRGWRIHGQMRGLRVGGCCLLYTSPSPRD